MKEKNWETPWGERRNHVVWLESDKATYHIGEEVGIRVLWGDMRKPEQGEYQKWRAYLIDPENERLELPITCEMLRFSSGKPYYFISFKPINKGNYVIVLENNYGIVCKLESGEWVYGSKKYHRNVKESFYFYQYAKTMISVGDIEKSNGKVGNELEIVPSKIVNDIIELTLLYNGFPIQGAQIKATYSGYAYTEKDPPGFYPFAANTNTDGKVEFEIKEKGIWLFVGEYKIMKGIEREYDIKWINATFSLQTKKEVD